MMCFVCEWHLKNTCACSLPFPPSFDDGSIRCTPVYFAVNFDVMNRLLVFDHTITVLSASIQKIYREKIAFLKKIIDEICHASGTEKSCPIFWFQSFQSTLGSVQVRVTSDSGGVTSWRSCDATRWRFCLRDERAGVRCAENWERKCWSSWNFGWKEDEGESERNICAEAGERNTRALHAGATRRKAEAEVTCRRRLDSYPAHNRNNIKQTYWCKRQL